MGLLADIITASDIEADAYFQTQSVAALASPDCRLEFKGLTGLEFGSLWSIIENEEWEVSKHMLKEVRFGEGGESWLMEFPVELVKILAALDNDVLSDLATAWSKTEELEYSTAEDLLPIIVGLKALASQAAQNRKKCSYGVHCENT